jgi:hypothetical protein
MTFHNPQKEKAISPLRDELATERKETTPLTKLARKKEQARKRDRLRIERSEISRDQLQAENSIIPMELANDPEWKATGIAAAVASLNRIPTKPTAMTLASKLGTVPHLSHLLRKLAKHGLKTPEEMAACAVQRGCHHYANMPAWKDIHSPPTPEISNEELAIGLLSPCHPYEPLFIRVGCQLLSEPQTNPKALAHLAVTERCCPILKYIATCGKETEPDNPFWAAILKNLPVSDHPQPEFPKSSIHISRFRAETGITNPFKPSLPKVVWLRPQPTMSTTSAK